jgi:hypothetical protein
MQQTFKLSDDSNAGKYKLDEQCKHHITTSHHIQVICMPALYVGSLRFNS